MSEEPPHGRGMAWATLLVSGGISWGVNLWHAFDQAEHVGWWFAALATMYGTAPVILAAFQSHSAAFTPMGWRKRWLTYLLVALGMVLSVQAQAESVAVFAGEHLKWIFPVFVDLSAFLALHTLMSSSGPADQAAPSTGVPDRAVAPVPVCSSTAVPDRAPVREAPVPAPPVPVREPGPRTGTGVPDRAVPVPVRPAVRTGPVPVPADRTAPADRVPDRTAEPGPTRPTRTTSPVPDRGLAVVPEIATPLEEPREPAAAAAAPAPARPKTTRPRTAKAAPPKAPAAKDDEAALKLLDKVLGDVDPATVSIRQVRTALGGARADRGKRLHALWAERRSGTGWSGRTGTGAAEGPGTPLGPDRHDGGTADHTAEPVPDQADQEEVVRSADRVPVPV